MIRVLVRGDRYNPRPFIVKKPDRVAFWRQMASWYPFNNKFKMGVIVKEHRGKQ